MKLYSRDNISFLLYELLDIVQLSSSEIYQAFDKDAIDEILNSMDDLAMNHLWPYYKIGDQNAAYLENGKVITHASIDQFIKSYVESGLLASTYESKYGGIHLPKLVYAATEYFGFAANNSYMMFSDLIYGCANLINTFGTDELKELYLPALVSGKYFGTMCLTEPQAGSSLSEIQTKAYPTRDGKYKIKGHKIFISAGDHTMGENIIHLVLARIDGAQAGTKGISLFIVPKYDITTAESNDVQSIAVYHKMGQKATPAMHLAFGEHDQCFGYLLGTEHKGLSQMFQMMNGARLAVGLSGVSIASAAYFHSLQYAQERKQGYKQATGFLPVSIIDHGDIQRLLFTQKAIYEGGLALILQCYLYLDLKRITNDPKYNTLIELLTPVSKTFGAEMGNDSVHQSLQIFGGYGYTEDFPLEQMARDIRIMSLYEGTTGIQAISLLGRQILDDQGTGLQILIDEILTCIGLASENSDVIVEAKILQGYVDELKDVTSHLLKVRKNENAEMSLINANLYLELLGYISVAWQWLRMGTISTEAISSNLPNQTKDFYLSKLETMKFYFYHILPKSKSLIESLMNEKGQEYYNKQLLLST